MPPPRHFLLALLAAALALGCSTAPATMPDALQICSARPEELPWIESALRAWERLNEEVLGRPARLPAIVLFDTSCTWRLGIAGHDGGRAAPLVFAGERLVVTAAAHRGTVVLPTGRKIRVGNAAFASLTQEDEPFFVLALPRVWMRTRPRQDPRELREFLLGVFNHEMVHTLQLPALRRRLRELGQRHRLPAPLDDTAIEEQFVHQPAFRRALEAERAALFAAALDPRRTSLVVAALDLVERRRSRFFTGTLAGYAEAEDLFLNLEGLAVWSHFRLSQLDPAIAFLPDRPDAEALPEVLGALADKNGEWVQDAGFAAFLLLESLAGDGWLEAALGEELTSPFALLREAVARQPGSLAARYSCCSAVCSSRGKVCVVRGSSAAAAKSSSAAAELRDRAAKTSYGVVESRQLAASHPRSGAARLRNAANFGY